MADESPLDPPRIRRRLASLARKPLNFELGAIAGAGGEGGWQVTDLRQPLPAEPPGMPLAHGSWALAQQIMRGYEFADPAIVRAYYDPAVPLERRDMLLKLQAFGVLHRFVGVRVGDVYEQTRVLAGRQARVWGWNYRTLQGHFEMGQMDWEVWKWIDSGEVEFRVHAVSKPAPISNPILWLGFRLLQGYERRAFLHGTQRRMREFVGAALEGTGRVQDASATGR